MTKLGGGCSVISCGVKLKRGLLTSFSGDSQVEVCSVYHHQIDKYALLQWFPLTMALSLVVHLH